MSQLVVTDAVTPQGMSELSPAALPGVVMLQLLAVMGGLYEGS
jgi:hypothetical protein